MSPTPPGAIRASVDAGPRINAAPFIVNFHAAIRHEFQHFLQRQRWTRDGRGIVMQAHSEWLEDYWSFWGGSERGIPFAAFNHYRDLDSDGRFTEGAACDLNADGDVGDVVFEGAVSHTCWGVVDEDAGSPAVADAEQGENVGGPTIEFDVNYDGLLDAPLLEWQVESLDWDGDRVPNWEDLFYTRPGDRSIQSPRERDGEIEAYRYGDDFAERLLLADPFRETDWSCPGVNISLEYCI